MFVRTSSRAHDKQLREELKREMRRIIRLLRSFLLLVLDNAFGKQSGFGGLSCLFQDGSSENVSELALVDCQASVYKSILDTF